MNSLFINLVILMKFQRIFFKLSNTLLVRTLKWSMLADRAPFELHISTYAGQGAMKPVARQAGVTIGGHGTAPTQKHLGKSLTYVLMSSYFKGEA